MSDLDIKQMLNYNGKKDYRIDFAVKEEPAKKAEVVVPLVKKEMPLVEPVIKPEVKPMTEELVIPETSSEILTEA